MARDDRLYGAMSAVRIKSSFIYLANAVNDLTGNWMTMGAVLTPLVIISALCLLPDALNLQHSLVRTFEPGVHNVLFAGGEHDAGAYPVQMPYMPERMTMAPPMFSSTAIWTIHLLLAVVTMSVNLVVLCLLARIKAGRRRNRILNEAIDVYKDALRIFPSFVWVVFLQILATAIGFILLIVPGVLAFVWLYFTQYALVFDGRRSWPALLHSRDLMRGRFFQVALRIVVFLAVWTGFNSWASAIFIGVSLALGLLGEVTGFLWLGVFAAGLLSVAVAYATTAFFFAAGVRLYQDLDDSMVGSPAANQSAMNPTVPLISAT